MKNWINRVVNIGLYWASCLLAASGLVLKFRLADEYPYPRGTKILGLGWNDWALLHLSLGLTIVSLVVVHLIMNRQWILVVAASRRTWALLAGLALGLLLFLIPLLAQPDSAPAPGSVAQKPSGAATP